MSKENMDLMERFMRLEALLHRYQMFNLRNHGPFGNPHRGQGRVLSILKMQPQISQKELGYLLDMRNQSLGELLNKLEKSGYITRTPSEEDRRTTNIKLTPEGQKATGTAGETKQDNDLFSSLNDEEQVQLSSYLDRIVTELEGFLSDSEADMPDFHRGMGPWHGRFGGHRDPDMPPQSGGPFGGRPGGFDPRGFMKHFGHPHGGWHGMEYGPNESSQNNPRGGAFEDDRQHDQDAPGGMNGGFGGGCPWESNAPKGMHRDVEGGCSQKKDEPKE